MELIATDLSGRRTGTDPRNGQQYLDIPSSSYGRDSIADDEDPATSDPTPEIKVFEMLNPPSGDYQVQAIGSGFGPYTLDFIAYDAAGNQSSTSLTENATPGSVATYKVSYSATPGMPVQVQLISNVVPPTITGMPPATGCLLWPPNRKLVDIATIGAVDNSGAGLQALDVEVTSSEPNAPGPGPQYAITGGPLGPKSLQLQAARLGDGTGRTYTITVTAQDLAGDTSRATATCIVPHDLGRE